MSRLYESVTDDGIRYYDVCTSYIFSEFVDTIKLPVIILSKKNYRDILDFEFLFQFIAYEKIRIQ